MEQPTLFINYPTSPIVTALPLREQPLSRVLDGPRQCNTAELLAALIGGPRQVEVAAALLEKFDSVDGILSAHPKELAAVRGVGKQAVARLKASLELDLRRSSECAERKAVSCPADAYAVLYPCFHGREQEHVFVLMLDTRNRVIGQPEEVYRGTLNSSWIRIGELFREAIRWNAASIIIAHGHPSGDPSPSPEDIAVTKQFKTAGELLDIDLQDHLVIGNRGRFVSLRERGHI